MYLVLCLVGVFGTASTTAVVAVVLNTQGITSKDGRIREYRQYADGRNTASNRSTNARNTWSATVVSTVLNPEIPRLLAVLAVPQVFPPESTLLYSPFLHYCKSLWC